MKPFSLEEYIKNPSRKIVTRDGKKVIQLNLYTDVENKFPIINALYTNSKNII